MNLLDSQIENSGFSFGTFQWWFGVVEKRDDPKRLGRVRVRVLGYHSPDIEDIKPNKLLWAYPLQPITSSAMNGIGISPTNIVEGTWCFGFFRDGSNAQDPIIMGTAGGQLPKDDDKDYKDVKTEKYHYTAEPEGDSDEGEPQEGFKDEWKTFPRDDFYGESDLNRLAKNDDDEEEKEKMKQTTIEKQKEGEDQKVPVAVEGMSRQEKQPKQHKEDVEENKNWTQKVTTYNALYPFNKVMETERGHQEEWDDTVDAERYRRWHRCGTFTEEHGDGDVVKRVKKDKYDIIMGKEFIHITGDCTVTVGANEEEFGEIESDKMEWKDNVERGEQPHCKDVPEIWDEEEDGKKYLDHEEDCKKYKKEWKKERLVDKSSLNLLVKGDVNVEVEGDMFQKVHGDYELYVKGEMRVKVEEDIIVKSNDTIYMDGGPDVHFNKPGPILDLDTENAKDPEWTDNEMGRGEDEENSGGEEGTGTEEGKSREDDNDNGGDEPEEDTEE